MKYSYGQSVPDFQNEAKVADKDIVFVAIDADYLLVMFDFVLLVDAFNTRLVLLDLVTFSIVEESRVDSVFLDTTTDGSNLLVW